MKLCLRASIVRLFGSTDDKAEKGRRRLRKRPRARANDLRESYLNDTTVQHTTSPSGSKLAAAHIEGEAADLYDLVFQAANNAPAPLLVRDRLGTTTEALGSHPVAPVEPVPRVAHEDTLTDEHKSTLRFSAVHQSRAGIQAVPEPCTEARDLDVVAGHSTAERPESEPFCPLVMLDDSSDEMAQLRLLRSQVEELAQECVETAMLQPRPRGIAVTAAKGDVIKTIRAAVRSSQYRADWYETEYAGLAARFNAAHRWALFEG